MLKLKIPVWNQNRKCFNNKVNKIGEKNDIGKERERERESLLLGSMFGKHASTINQSIINQVLWRSLDLVDSIGIGI